jgi:hypothetical protein
VKRAPGKDPFRGIKMVRSDSTNAQHPEQTKLSSNAPSSSAPPLISLRPHQVCNRNRPLHPQPRFTWLTAVLKSHGQIGASYVLGLDTPGYRSSSSESGFLLACIIPANLLTFFGYYLNKYVSSYIFRQVSIAFFGNSLLFFHLCFH